MSKMLTNPKVLEKIMRKAERAIKASVGFQERLASENASDEIRAIWARREHLADVEATDAVKPLGITLDWSSGFYPTFKLSVENGSGFEHSLQSAIRFSIPSEHRSAWIAWCHLRSLVKRGAHIGVTRRGNMFRLFVAVKRKEDKLPRVVDITWQAAMVCGWRWFDKQRHARAVDPSLAVAGLAWKMFGADKALESESL